MAAHLLGVYGADAARVLAYASRAPDALDRIHDGGPDVLAQAYYARDHEYALTVDDIVSRRTTLEVRGLADESIRQRIDSLVVGRDRVPAIAAL